MNNGSAGGVAITIIGIYENFRSIIQISSIIFIMQIIIKITSLKTNKRIKLKISTHNLLQTINFE